MGVNQLKSKRLEENGLINRIAGSDYNFRYQKAGNRVVEDLEKVLRELAIVPKEIYSGQQTHSAHIEYVDGMNGEAFVFGKTFKDTDGLITDQTDVALLIKFADCTPVVLYDPVKKVQASVHSGWRGTTKQISLKAIERMVEQFECDKETILAYVGPSINLANYEVGPEVYEAFKEFKSRDDFFEPRGEKYLMSMLDANLSILLEAGLKAENIDIERASTYTDNRLHSARKEGPEYKLNGIVTMMSS